MQPQSLAGAPARALIVQSGFLGDVVLATPLIAALGAAGYYVDFLTTPVSAPVLSAHPLLREVVLDDKRGARRGLAGLLRTTRELAARGYDLAVAPHRSHRTSIMLCLARIPRRVGFASAPWSFLFTDRVTVPPEQHQIAKNRSLLAPLGLARDFPVSLRMPPEVQSEAQKLLSGLPRPLVGVAPGSAWATKQWLPERFSEALRLVRSRRAIGVVLLGTSDQTQAAREVARGFEGPLLNLTGATSLQVAAAIISRLDLLIANDSAPVHIAGAYSVPTVAIFLATHPRQGFGPALGPYRVAQTDLACRPCSPHGGARCPLGHFNCARMLDSEQVARQALELLAAGCRPSDG